MGVEPINIDALADSIDESVLPDDFMRYARLKAKELDRVFTDQCQKSIYKEEGFAYECNLRIDQLKNVALFDNAGYDLVLIYIWLDNVAISKQRVAKRVSQGGHFVDNSSIQENFKSGLANLDSSFLDWSEVYMFDNSVDFQEGGLESNFPLLLHIKEQKIQYCTNLFLQKENIAEKLPHIHKEVKAHLQID